MIIHTNFSDPPFLCCNPHPRADVPQVTAVTHKAQAAAAKNVSVPHGERCLDHVTQSQANAAAGSGQRDSRVTSAWKGMCVDQLGSPVRLTHTC